MITLTTTPGGSPAGTQFDLHDLGAAPPLRFFRKALYLRLNGDATKLTFNPALTTFKAQFQPQTYNALNQSNNALRGKITKLGNYYVIELNAPRSLSYVRVNNPPHYINAYRMDGDALSEEPTLEFAYGVPSNLVASSGIAVGNVAVMKTMSLNSSISMEGISSGGVGIDIGIDIAAIAMLKRAPLSAGQFVDQRFALRFLTNNAIVQPAINAITEVAVRSLPTGVRLGIAPANQLDQAVFFWTQAGESQSTVSANVGDQLADALNAHLSRFTTPGVIDIALVIESDAECGFSLQQVSLRPLNIVDTFASNEPKQVLRFESGREQTAFVTLPRAANVITAQVIAVESLRGDRVNQSNSSTGSAARGAHIGAGRAAAQQIMPTEAISISGVGLLLNPLVSKTALSVELQEDWQGSPSGKVLASGTLMFSRTGSTALDVVYFAQPVILSTLPCWIVVRATAGQAVWIAQSGSGLSVFDQANGTLSRHSSLDGLGAVYQWLTRSGANETSAAGLRIGAQTLVGVVQEDQSKRYDLATALNVYLSTLPATPLLVDVPLVYTSDVTGLVTLNNLYIEYEVS